jgi:hypothetical protein
MAIDLDDVRNAVVEAIESDLFGGKALRDIVTDSLSDELPALIDSTFDDTDDEENAADNADYPAGEVGADDEGELDERRADFIAGYNAAYAELREAFEGIKNL